MLRDYEFTMIVRPDLSEEDIGAVLAHYEQKIAAREGRVLRKDVVGTKRFSYPIKRCFRGYFVNYDISANPKIVKDMEHQIRFDDKVLRHLIIGMERRRSAAVREEIAAEQKRIAAAQAESVTRAIDSDAVPASHTETVISSDAPVSEMTESENASPARETTTTAEAAAPDDTATVDDDVPPSHEDTGSDAAQPLTEDTESDATPASGTDDEKPEQPHE